MEKAQAVLVWVMRGMLKLLHPYMTYITEEIWQVLTGGESMIIVESYPVYDAKYDYADAAQFEKVIDAIRAIRNRRTEMQVPPSKKARVCIETTEPELYRALRYSLKSWHLHPLWKWAKSSRCRMRLPQ
ncbi:MAG: class I tRNA ligase family protein [Ruminococcus sp.]